MADRTYVIGPEERSATGSTVVKIGHAKSPYARLKTLQTGFPYKLVLLAEFPNISGTTEKTFHDKYARFRTVGGGTEWFDIPNVMLDDLLIHRPDLPILWARTRIPYCTQCIQRPSKRSGGKTYTRFPILTITQKLPACPKEIRSIGKRTKLPVLHHTKCEKNPDRIFARGLLRLGSPQDNEFAPVSAPISGREGWCDKDSGVAGRELVMVETLSNKHVRSTKFGLELHLPVWAPAFGIGFTLRAWPESYVAVWAQAGAVAGRRFLVSYDGCKSIGLAVPEFRIYGDSA